MAVAMSNMSQSVPAPFNAFTAWSTNRQLLTTYPLLATILSKLGEKRYGHRCVLMKNGIFVTSQRPVHRSTHHALVKSNGNPSFLALAFAPFRAFSQGVVCRVF